MGKSYKQHKCLRCGKTNLIGIEGWIWHSLNECGKEEIDIISDVPKLVNDLGYEQPSLTNKRKERYGIFECQFMNCHKTYRATISSVMMGRSKSCGCRLTFVTTKHGMCGTRLYHMWNGMINRCYNESGSYFHLYGGNGVRVCDEWRSDFRNFMEWALNNGYADNLSINRIRGSKMYSPDTCNFVDCSHQSQDTKLIKSNNTSGYRGVSWDKNKRKWSAYIGLYGKHYFLGYYDNPIDGARAFNNWVIEHNTHHTLNILE